MSDHWLTLLCLLCVTGLSLVSPTTTDDQCTPGCTCTPEDEPTLVICDAYSGTDIPDCVTPSVTNLSITGSKIKSLTPECFTNATGLKTFVLTNSTLDSVQNGTFAGLEHLTTLDLSANKLREIEDGVFDGCGNVSELILSGNQLTELNGLTFRGLENLMKLDLSKNAISEIGNDTFQYAPLIGVLIMDENPLKTLEGQNFEGLTNLAQLNISNMPELHQVEENAFSDATNLMQIHLAENKKLTTIPSNALENCTKLVYAGLYNNSISEFPEDLFGDKPYLTVADITGNPINCSCSASWIGDRMANDTQPPWLANWKDQVKCFTPSNLKGMFISDLHPEDLTCKPASINHKHVMLTAGEVFMEAHLVGGLPSTLWITPSGAEIMPLKNASLVPKTNDSIVATEWLLDDLRTVVARLHVRLDLEANSGQFTLKGMNAALENASASLSYDLPESNSLHRNEWIAIGVASGALVIVLSLAAYLFVKSRKQRDVPYTDLREEGQND